MTTNNQKNSSNTVSTNTATVSPANNLNKPVRLDKYKELNPSFSISKYLRDLYHGGNNITTDDAWDRLKIDHPMLIFPREKFGPYLSQIKSNMKAKNKVSNHPSPDTVTMEDLVRAKEAIKTMGGLDELIACVKAYKTFSDFASQVGGSDRAIKILDMMNALRGE